MKAGESEEDEEELNPEQLIPEYVKLQAQIYDLDPISTAISGSRKGGKGLKTTQAPKELSSEQMKNLKKLQDKLRALIQDPLLDLRSAELIWAEERLRLEKESWAKKQPKGKWDDKNSHTSKPQTPLLSRGTVESDGEDSKEGVQFASSEHGSIEDDDLGMGLIGGLFEPPPTEETTVGQNGEEMISIRNFEEEAGFTVSSFGKNKPKGKTGVGSILVKSVLDEVCKSRYVLVR